MKKIIVIGGGFAGSEIARSLENEFEVTLIDSKDYFEFTPGVLRTIVEPEHAKKIQAKHSEYLKKTRIIVDEVTSVSETFVEIEKKKFTYDYLVIASGSRYDAPFKEQGVVSETRAEHLVKHYETLKNARNVLIVGGGLVGIELAGEIIWKYGREKNVTIVQSGEKLIARNHPRAIKYATKWLSKKGVKVLCGRKIVGKHGKKCVTDKEEDLEADLVFFCTGIYPNYEFMKKHYKDAIDEKGFLRVNENLQLLGQNRIFVVGDVSNRKEEKTAQNAEKQAEVVAQNILRTENGEKLEKYVSKKTPMVISLGKNSAIFDNGKFVICGWIVSCLKRIVEWKEMRKKRR